MKRNKISAVLSFVLLSGIILSCSSEKKAEQKPEPEVTQEPAPQPEPTPAPEKPVKKAEPVVEESYPETVYSLPKERSATEIGNVINNHDTEMKEIFHGFKANDPSLRGTIVFSAGVSPEGKVVSVTMKQSDLRDKNLERALSNRIRLWTFSEIEKSVGNVNYDIKYSFTN